METPLKNIPFIIKALNEKCHANSLCEGNMILRSHNYYRECVTEEKRDKDEFCLKYPDHIRSLTNSGFIFSAHDESFAKKKSRHGNWLVKINDPCSLFEEIKEKIKSIIINNQQAYFGNICYLDYKKKEQPKHIEYYYPIEHFFNIAFYEDIKFRQ